MTPIVWLLLTIVLFLICVVVLAECCENWSRNRHQDKLDKSDKYDDGTW